MLCMLRRAVKIPVVTETFTAAAVVYTHRSASLVVMQVRGAPQISPSLVDVDEISREPVAERDVVAAAAPLPISRTCRPRCARWGGACRPLAPASTPGPLTALRSWEVVSLAARAGIDGARTTGAGQRVRQGGARYGVNERRFPTTCARKTQQSCFTICTNIHIRTITHTWYRA